MIEFLILYWVFSALFIAGAWMTDNDVPWWMIPLGFIFMPMFIGGYVAYNS